MENKIYLLNYEFEQIYKLTQQNSEYLESLYWYLVIKDN